MNDAKARLRRRRVALAVTLALVAGIAGTAHALKQPKGKSDGEKKSGFFGLFGGSPKSSIENAEQAVGNAVSQKARQYLPATPGARVATEIDSTLAGPRSGLAHSDEGPEQPAPTERPAADNSGTVPSEALDDVLLRPEPYFYDGLGRRDPFVSLVTDEYMESVREEDRLRPDDLAVVGILWGDGDRFALLETAEGRSLILREGDEYGSATVTRIHPDGVVLFVNEYGVGRTIKVGVSDAKKRSNNADRER